MPMTRWFIRLVIMLTTFLLVNAAPTAASAALSNTPDVTWMTNGTVRAVMRFGDHIYIGGQFTRVKQTPSGGEEFVANRLARIDAATGVADPSWTPDVTWGSFVTTRPPIVWALAAAGGKIWFGGDFGAVDGVPRTNFAAVDAVSGAVDPNVDSPIGALGDQFAVRALAASSSLVYVTGDFTDVGGVLRKNLAAFHLDGTLDATWAPKIRKRAFSMTWDCAAQSLFVGGQFRSARGSTGKWQTRETVARFDPVSGRLHPWAIPAGTIEEGQKALDLAPTCSQLNTAYGGSNYAAAFTLSEGDVGRQLWRTSTNGNVQAVENVNDLVVIGGHFTNAAGIRRIRIAALSAASGALDGAWHPDIEGAFGGPWDLLADVNRLYVGGHFTLVEGVAQHYFARFSY
jgi:hypothetical protein